MAKQGKPELIDPEKKVFDIEDEEMHRGAWWWFWLFFFNNPKDPEKPQQLMILWSIKNVNEVDCNHLKIRADNNGDRSKLEGVVAAWYYDGHQMHHNFLLEQCNLNVSDNKITSDSTPSTFFSINKTENTITIGEDFKFIAEEDGKNHFTQPNYNTDIFFANKGYSAVTTKYLKLRGKVRETPIQGSAYFQRVFVNAPNVPWYWGVFHFEKGAVLSYFNPYLFGKSLKRDVSFFDGNQTHILHHLKIKRSGKETPMFKATAENKDEKIEFTVKTYSHSSWTFKRKALGFIPNKQSTTNTRP